MVFVTHKRDMIGMIENSFNEQLMEYQNIEHKSETEYKDTAYLIHLKCIRQPLGNLSQNDGSKLAFIGSHYVSVWRPVHIIDDPESTDYWSRIEIDPYYLSRNWPIRELAVNPRSDCIAIAGATGFALYNRKTADWKLSIFIVVFLLCLVLHSWYF